MKREYDLSGGKRGAVLKPPPGTTRITLGVDDDVLDWFREQVHAAGGGVFTRLMADVLREYVASREGTKLRKVVRRAVREPPRQRKAV